MIRPCPANPTAPDAPATAGGRRVDETTATLVESSSGQATDQVEAPAQAYDVAHGVHDLKSPAQIARMAAAGRIVAKALAAAAARCQPGNTTADVDEAARKVIEASGAEALFLGHPHRRTGVLFPGVVCVSVNEVVVHGVPGERRLESGDLVTVDCGVRLDGWCADAAKSVTVGTVGEDLRDLTRTAELALATGIRLIRPGIMWSEVARIMHAIVLDAGYGVVTGYVGHGIGRTLHESPQVPAFVTPHFRRHHDFELIPGMTLAIEPMLALGSARTRELKDGWSVVTDDGLPAVHVEHTVAVTRQGATVLTGASASSVSSVPSRDCPST